jgi:hypothetical protein
MRSDTFPNRSRGVRETAVLHARFEETHRLVSGVVRSRCSVLDGIGWLAGLNVEAVVEEFVWLVLSNSDGRAAE